MGDDAFSAGFREPRGAPDVHRPVTRNDVARAAGVSSAVVSYVINNGPRRVSPATEAKVREAIQRLGYRPNLTARALSSGSTQLLGLVLIDLVNPFFAELAHAVESAAARRQHAIMIAHSNNDPETEQRRTLELESRGVDGLIISTLLLRDDLVAWAKERAGRRVPDTVILNAEAGIPGVHTIGPDFEGGTRDGVEHLIAHGHRSIGLVSGTPFDDPDKYVPGPRHDGWRGALRDAQLPLGPIELAPYSREGGYAAGRRLLARRPRPTAVFAASDLLGVGVLRAAHDLGLRVPEDLAVVCFDGTSESAYSWPPLTAVTQPVAAMSEAAVAQVLDPDPALVGRHQMHPTTLTVRRSCGCEGPERITSDPESAASSA